MIKWKRVAVTGVMVALWLTSTAAYALKCMSPSSVEEQAKAVYLIRINYIDEKLTEHSAREYEWNGNMQVLKVYRGDAQAVSALTQLIVYSSCDINWGPPCDSVSEPVVRVGEQWLIFDLSEGTGYAGISRDECLGPSRVIEGAAQLEAFERDNSPLWVRDLP